LGRLFVLLRQVTCSKKSDGKLLYAEWNSGYEDWLVGDRVFLSTESGEGFMFYGNKRTQVDVSFYNPSGN